MKQSLIAAARALDAGRPDEARATLHAAPLEPCDQSLRLIALALWTRLLLTPPAGTTVAGTTPDDDALRETSKALDTIGTAIRDSAFIWNAYAIFPALEARIGAADMAALVATTLWHRTLEGSEGFFAVVFELIFRGGGDRRRAAWEQFLTQRKDFIPIYWHWLLAAKTFNAVDPASILATAARMLEKTGREDLQPLLAVYLKQMRQAPVSEIIAAARTLTDPQHRERVAAYMTGMGYMPDELPLVVAFFAELMPDTVTREANISLMQSRLASAEGRWRDAADHARIAAEDPQHAHVADLLRAHALARLHEHQEAAAVLDAVAADKTPSYLQARVSYIRVNAALIKNDRPTPEQIPPRIFAATPGRPLAQSLWVGPSLRWIERLVIQSYLDNGWRFQLYVYDDPQNVPAGCEVLDAAAIIPTRDVFIEGAGSGLHAGSIGAFSDLFRYRLLYERGGMWTDTDVINLRKFDPDGQKFVSTDVADAGLVSLNGALMASPAHDKFVGLAYERAAALLKSRDMFFTRIGPYLLAELVSELGVDAIELMPLGFLSPISWMNTGSLLRPYEAVMARPEIRNAVNLHVYTEMWRLLGLGLDRPPAPDTFLGRLYADHCGALDA